MSIAEPMPASGLLRQPVSVVRVPAGAIWTVALTSRNAVTCWTHFSDGRTVYCRRPEHDCVPCDLRLSRRWESYTSAWNVTRQSACILCVPAAAWATMVLGEHEDWRGKLRGRRYSLARPGEDRRGKLLAERLVDWFGPDKLPAGQDVPSILERLWGLPSGFLQASTVAPVAE